MYVSYVVKKCKSYMSQFMRDDRNQKLLQGLGSEKAPHFAPTHLSAPPKKIVSAPPSEIRHHA